MITVFAETLQTRGGGLVADVGCGPGHVTAHLSSLGLPAFGVDLSPEMIAQACSSYPDMRFEIGTMDALKVEDGTLAGVLANYSIIPSAKPGTQLRTSSRKRAVVPSWHRTPTPAAWTRWIST